MIEFKGNLTAESKRFLLRKQIKMQILSSSIAISLFLLPIIFSAIFLNIMLLWLVLPLVLLAVFSLFKTSKSSQKTFMPTRIYLDLEEETILQECEKAERFHILSSVKSVIDYGDWYYLVFNYEDRDPYFVCQKDLLTQGTLEEFEALFEGKIVKKSIVV